VKLTRSMELMKEYEKCPKCGNSHIANGEGKLIVEDTTFHRSCKCGWEVTIEE